jgi:hypothetical protein
METVIGDENGCSAHIVLHHEIIQACTQTVH